MENEMFIPWWISEKRKPFRPLTMPLEGAWRLTGIGEYEKERGHWFVPSQKLWGPKEFVFENNVVTIHSPEGAKSLHYAFFPTKRYVLIDENLWFVSNLTANKLILHLKSRHGPLKYTLERIDPLQIHEKSVKTHLPLGDLSGLWNVDAKYHYTQGRWCLQTDYRNIPGLYLWDIEMLPYWDELTFGHPPRTHGDAYKSLNKEHFIFRQYVNWQKSYFFHPLKDTQGYWAYQLDSITEDYRDSRIKLHLTRIDRTRKDMFVESLLWAESGRHYAQAADKIPLEMLRLWCVSNPKNLANMVAEDTFMNHSEEYRSEIYAGVYVFLHHFIPYAKKDVSVPAATAYLTFQEILRIWLALYDKGQVMKFIYPFCFSKYPAMLAMLHKQNRGK